MKVIRRDRAHDEPLRAVNKIIEVEMLMSYTQGSEGGVEDLVARKFGLKPSQPPITQIMIFEKSGKCLLWIGSRGEELQEDMVASLLSALCGFSLEALGLELTEIATKQKRIFLAGTTRLFVAIMVNEEAMVHYTHIREQIFGLMDRTIELMTMLEEKPSLQSCLDNPNRLGYLRYEIEMEIARIFPTSHLNSTEFGLNPSDLPKLRILTYMGDQRRHTFAKIVEELSLPEFVVAENLRILEEKGLVIPQRVQFGQRYLRTYRISELGKLILDQIDGSFPGLIR
ncbi:MAG: hypothetical protein ACE5R6_16115 [Candidatus Heimdallarchaeota archaeon]